LGQYYLSEALVLFYGFINQFYNPILEKQRFSCQSTLFATATLLVVFFSLLAIFTWKYMKIYYRFLALSLSIMPYDKITEDEATIQIIENFTKKTD